MGFGAACDGFGGRSAGKAMGSAMKGGGRSVGRAAGKAVFSSTKASMEGALEAICWGLVDEAMVKAFAHHPELFKFYCVARVVNIAAHCRKSSSSYKGGLDYATAARKVAEIQQRSFAIDDYRQSTRDAVENIEREIGYCNDYEKR